MNNEKTYQQTIKSNLNYYLFALIALIVIISCFFYANQMLIYIFFIILLFIWVIPTTFIHLQYFLNDFRITLKINSFTNTITIINEKTAEKKVIENNEISKIEIVKRAMKGDGGTYWFTWGPYCYYRIILTNNKHILITCLTIDETDINSLSAKKVVKNRIIPYISSTDKY